MTAVVRALLAMLFLLAVFGVGVGIVLGILAGVGALIASGREGTAEIVFVGVFGSLAVVLTYRFSRPTVVRPSPGRRVSRAQQPELWGFVDEIARATRTRGPSVLRLVPEANAAVEEDARLLGLLPGRRTLEVGLPLLLALTRGQLRAVLIHEFGHYAKGHARLGVLTFRVIIALERMVMSTRNATSRRVLRACANVFLSLTRALSRRQEFEADAAAARLAGRDQTVSALCEVAVVEAAWERFLDERLLAAARAGRAPKDMYAGFRDILADPAYADEWAGIRAEPPHRESSPYDTHPPLPERVGAVGRLPAGPHRPGDGTPAIGLLVDPAATLLDDQDLVYLTDRFADTALVRRMDAYPRLDWAVLLRVLARSQAAADVPESIREPRDTRESA